MQLLEVTSPIPADLARLPELAANLFFSWHRPARALFQDLDPELWEQVERNPYMNGDMPAGSLHYRCRVRLYPNDHPKQNRRQLTAYFSKGPGLNGGVKLDELLDCIASDSASVEHVETAEEWCNDYGAECNHRAELSFRATLRQRAKTQKMFGLHWYETLLYHTERL